MDLYRSSGRDPVGIGDHRVSDALTASRELWYLDVDARQATLELWQQCVTLGGWEAWIGGFVTGANKALSLNQASSNVSNVTRDMDCTYNHHHPNWIALFKGLCAAMACRNGGHRCRHRGHRPLCEPARVGLRGRLRSQASGGHDRVARMARTRRSMSVVLAPRQGGISTHLRRHVVSFATIQTILYSLN